MKFIIDPIHARLRAGLRAVRSGCGLALVIVFAACGGGVGTGGTGTYTYGPITGFGSIIVGGVRFDDSLARVEDDDGTTRSRSELKLGMTVGIDSDSVASNANGSVATAASVRFGFDPRLRVHVEPRAEGGGDDHHRV
jgi:hypothetical protein